MSTGGERTEGPANSNDGDSADGERHRLEETIKSDVRITWMIKKITAYTLGTASQPNVEIDWEKLILWHVKNKNYDAYCNRSQSCAGDFKTGHSQKKKNIIPY